MGFKVMELIRGNLFKGGIPEEDVPDIDIKQQSDISDITKDVIAFATSKENVARLNAVERGMYTKEFYLSEIREYVCDRYHLGKEDKETEEILDGFSRFMWSYYILDPLIADTNITDIRIISYDKIFIHKSDGTRQLTDVRFADEEDYRRFIERTAMKMKVSISDNNAMQAVTDKTQEGWILRVQISTKFVINAKTAYLHIRKEPAKKYTMDELVRKGMLTRKQADYLIERIRKGESVLFCGAGGCGKTTLLNALIEYMVGRSIYCVQSEDELFMENPEGEFMSYHSVEGNGEGKVRYSLADVSKTGLLVDVNVFINAEIKGPEALDFLTFVYSGCTGYGIVHAPSEEDAFMRIAYLAKKASDYSVDEIFYMLRHIKKAVFLNERKVESISSVDWNGEERKLEFRKEM